MPSIWYPPNVAAQTETKDSLVCRILPYFLDYGTSMILRCTTDSAIGFHEKYMYITIGTVNIQA
jgi:hypothetical protein